MLVISTNMQKETYVTNTPDTTEQFTGNLRGSIITRKPPVTAAPIYKGDLKAKGERHHAPKAVRGRNLADIIFFILAGLASLALTLLMLVNTIGHSWWGIVVALVFWAFTAYLTLPRLHAVMTAIYVPDYFIGRTRTGDGLLGDPVNLGVIGTEEQLHQAMLDAGWTRADDVTLASSWKIIVSTLTRKSYAEAPVSPLKIFGNIQSFAYQQEVDGNPEKRHHVRFWKTPEGWLLPGGERVDWLGAGTYDSGVGFSFFTLQVTHRIDAETDFERDYIVDSVQYAYPETEVDIIENFSSGYHARNGGGDEITTDGHLPVITLKNPGLDPIEAPKDINLTSAKDVAQRLPMSMLMGSLMLLITSVFEIVNIFATAANRSVLREAFEEAGDFESAQQLVNGSAEGEAISLAITAILIILVGIVALVQLWLMISMLRGYGGARLLSLTILAIGVTSQVVTIIVNPHVLPLGTLFIQLGVSVFAMLAFTSDAAVNYTYHRGVTRRHRKLLKKAHKKAQEAA